MYIHNTVVSHSQVSTHVLHFMGSMYQPPYKCMFIISWLGTKRPCGPKSPVMLKHPWAFTRDTTVQTTSLAPMLDSLIHALFWKTDLPLVECSPKLLELIETHLSRAITVQHGDHDPTRILAEGLVGPSNAWCCQTLLQLLSINLTIL